MNDSAAPRSIADGLQEEISRLWYALDSEQSKRVALQAENNSLEAGVELLMAEVWRLKADAERYRWLRERGDAFQWENILRFDLDECNHATNAIALDSAIDAVMAADPDDDFTRGAHDL